MKLDKLQIKLIIKLLFAAVMFITIYFVELKMKKQQEKKNEYEQSRTNEVKFSDMTQLY